jgi:hypothetical protein
MTFIRMYLCFAGAPDFLSSRTRSGDGSSPRCRFACQSARRDEKTVAVATASTCATPRLRQGEGATRRCGMRDGNPKGSVRLLQGLCRFGLIVEEPRFRPYSRFHLRKTAMGKSLAANDPDRERSHRRNGFTVAKETFQKEAWTPAFAGAPDFLSS